MSKQEIWLTTATLALKGSGEQAGEKQMSDRSQFLKTKCVAASSTLAWLSFLT